ACGTPEQVAACAESHTGRFLKPLLDRQPLVPPAPAPAAGRKGRGKKATVAAEPKVVKKQEKPAKTRRKSVK
ncbi:hypothetical protein, partial [Komagataeibacter saccharivorans]